MINEDEAFWSGIAVAVMMLGGGFSMLFLPSFTGYGSVVLALGLMTMALTIQMRAKPLDEYVASALYESGRLPLPTEPIEPPREIIEPEPKDDEPEQAKAEQSSAESAKPTPAEQPYPTDNKPTPPVEQPTPETPQPQQPVPPQVPVEEKPKEEPQPQLPAPTA